METFPEVAVSALFPENGCLKLHLGIQNHVFCSQGKPQFMGLQQSVLQRCKNVVIKKYDKQMNI